MRDVRLPDFPYAHPIEVRFRDLDPMGHVHNSVTLTYFEQARVGYWLSALPASRTPGPLTDLTRLGFFIVHASCDYISPARLGEPLLVGCRVTELGRTSFGFEYRIVSGAISADSEARAVATGRTVQVLWDWAENRKLTIPDELRKRIEEVEGRELKRPR